MTPHDSTPQPIRHPSDLLPGLYASLKMVREAQNQHGGCGLALLALETLIETTRIACARMERA